MLMKPCSMLLKLKNKMEMTKSKPYKQAILDYKASIILITQ